MMRGRLIGSCWPTMRRICVTRLGAVTLLSAPNKTAYFCVRLCLLKVKTRIDLLREAPARL